MFSLIETIIGFSAIMLLLSILVKSMTSVVKNHVDYYSENFRKEVERLICGTIDKKWKDLESTEQLKYVQWRRLDEEYLTKDNMNWLLSKLGAAPDKLKNLEARLEVHKSNIRYAFAKRTNNIALALGLGLCLFMNINAFTIWDTLYNDQQARAKFSSQEYINSVYKLIKENADENITDDAEVQQKKEENEKKLKGNTTTKDAEEQRKKEENEKKLKGNTTANAEEQRKELKEQREVLMKQLHHLQVDVYFGIGRIWREEVNWPAGFFYEFFGSLLTGILVSIGAPYWHDLLQALIALRQPKKTAKKPQATE